MVTAFAPPPAHQREFCPSCPFFLPFARKEAHSLQLELNKSPSLLSDGTGPVGVEGSLLDQSSPGCAKSVRLGKEKMASSPHKGVPSFFSGEKKKLLCFGGEEGREENGGEERRGARDGRASGKHVTGSWGGRGKRVGEEKEFNEESHVDPLLSFFLKTKIKFPFN